nr:probable protein phosphatase 2C 75 [Ipomoea batatas]
MPAVSPVMAFSIKDAEIWRCLPDLEQTDFEGLAGNGLKKVAVPGGCTLFWLAAISIAFDIEAICSSEMMPDPSSPAITHAMTALVVEVMSISGWSCEMEDALCVRPNLCNPEINCCRPLHYFALFDGHGGAHPEEGAAARRRCLLQPITGDALKVRMLKIRQAAPNLSVFEGEGHHWTHRRHMHAHEM